MKPTQPEQYRGTALVPFQLFSRRTREGRCTRRMCSIGFPSLGKQVGTPLVVALTLAVLVGACATNPVTGRREFALMSEAQEISLGRELDVEVRREMGVYEDQELQQYVEDIGLRLAADSHRPDLPWHFTVVNVTAVNAFALPGGYIYLTRGIMAYLSDEADLAGVLGHEIGHVTARHAVQAYTRATGGQLGLLVGAIFVPQTQAFGGLAQTGLGVLSLRYGRDDELQADRLGAEYAATSGWDPAGVPDLLTILARIEEASDRQGIPNWLSTHPQPADRVDEVSQTVAELRVKVDHADFRVNRGGYLRRIDGLVYGDNPEEGIVRGSTFLHPELRFELRFPDGWQVQNSQTQVVAKQPGEDVFMFLQLVEEPRRRDLGDIAASNMRQAGYTLTQGDPTTISGLEAYVGTYAGDARGIGDVTARIAHIAHGRNFYSFGGLAKSEIYPRVERDFSASIQTFRPLSPTEANDIRPNRVSLYVVRQGDNWQSIAQRAGEGIVEPTTLAIMNGYPVNEQPRPGDQIKIVIAG